MLIETIILGISLYIIWTIADNYFPLKRLPPGPFRVPILGNTLTFLNARGKPTFVFFRDLSKKYGPATFIRMGLQPAIVTADFTLSKQILNHELWIDRPFTALDGERSYGEPLGLIFSSGDSWREMRRFSIRTLRDFGYGKQTNMQVVIDQEVSRLLEKIETEITAGQGTLNLKYLFTMPVLNNLWSMVSSARTAADEKKLAQLAMLVDNLSKATPVGRSIIELFPALRHVAPGWTRVNIMREGHKQLHEYFQQILDTRRAEGGWKGEGRDFIDMFIQEIDKHEKMNTTPNHFNDKQFNVSVMDLFEAGSETSSNTLEFTIYYIMNTPRVQRKVQEEIDRVVGRNRLPSMADKAEMPYTVATLMEVQRMANVLPMTARCPTENCTLGGYFVEKGTLGIVNIYAIHMDKDFWGDPYVFRPERFLDGENKIIPEKAQRVIAFGQGKRVCLGEQMARATLFSYFTALLQNFTFKEDPSGQTEQLDDNKKNFNDIDWTSLAKHPDPDAVIFEKFVHPGFTLSPKPFKAKVANR